MNSDQQNNTDQSTSEKSRWYKFFLNKYLIVSVLFVVWMIFFDQNSFLIHRELDKEITELKKEEIKYSEKFEKESIQLQKMKTNPNEVERIAREKHFLKRENEDVFIIEKRKVNKEKNDAGK